MKPVYTDGGDVWILQDDNDEEVGYVADLAMGRVHPPLLLAEIIANGGGCYRPVKEDEKMPDFEHLDTTAYHDRTRSRPTLGESVVGDTETTPPMNRPTVGLKGASFEGAPISPEDA